MTSLKAYKVSLALPLLLPLLFAPLVFLEDKLPDGLAFLVIVIIYSGILGGIPYILLVACLLWWGRGKSERQFKLALIASPILMAPLCWALLVVVALWQVNNYSMSELYRAASEVVGQSIVFTIFVLGFGYAYVGLMFGVVWVLKRLGVLHSSEPPDGEMVRLGLADTLAPPDQFGRA